MSTNYSIITTSEQLQRDSLALRNKYELYLENATMYVPERCGEKLFYKVRAKYSFCDKITQCFNQLPNNEIIAISKTMESDEECNLEVMVQNGDYEIGEIFLNYFDSIILNAIFSLLRYNHIFSIQMLKDCLGCSNSQTMNDLILSSIDKLRTTYFYINADNSIAQKNGFKGMGAKAVLLPLKERYANRGGKKVLCYELDGECLYFDYCEYTKQIITRGIDKVPQYSKSMDVKALIIYEYVTTRIQSLKNRRSYNSNLNNIRIETLVDLIATIIPFELTDTRFYRIRKTLISILEECKKCQYIEDFTIHNNTTEIYLKRNKNGKSKNVGK